VRCRRVQVLVLQGITSSQQEFIFISLKKTFRNVIIWSTISLKKLFQLSIQRSTTSIINHFECKCNLADNYYQVNWRYSAVPRATPKLAQSLWWSVGRPDIGIFIEKGQKGELWGLPGPGPGEYPARLASRDTASGLARASHDPEDLPSEPAPRAPVSTN